MSNIIVRALFLSLLFSPFYTDHAQTVSSDTGFRINSSVLGEDRPIIVRVPEGYHQGDKRYPVIYMLDGHQPHIRMMEGILDQQSFSSRIPELILVSIPNVNRFRDMTPTKTDVEGSGGGDNFLRFIESEVFPLVEKNYRTEPYRILAGHSLAGLTAVNAMITRPSMFNGYIAASPGIYWDNEHVVKKAAELFKSKPEMKRSLFISVGDEPRYLPAINKFRELISRSKPKGLKYEIRHWPDEDHGSIVLRAYFEGLRHIYKGWSMHPAEITSQVKIEDHYTELSKRFGYQIKSPETLLNQFGYFQLQDNRIIEALNAFKKNVELYPHSANALDSLAEAFEKNGSKDKAREHYEKAYLMAEKNGESQLAATAKANFQRLSKK